MININSIFNYHLRNKNAKLFGMEYELFCLNTKYNKVTFNKEKKFGTKNIFRFLERSYKFKKLNNLKTIGITKNGSKFTLEPGSQLEYSTRTHNSTNSLIGEYFILLKIFNNLIKKLPLKLSDLSLLSIRRKLITQILPLKRYKIMSKYFDKIGYSGRMMMTDTTSLQLTFGYESLADLEEKVNRLIFLKPILLLLSSNSRYLKGIDTGYHSYRNVIWNKVDKRRCGYPGIKNQQTRRWTLKSYVEKVINAPTIFDVINAKHTKSVSKPFKNLIDKCDLDSYIFHNNTIFTDLRIKDYIEMRYLDNPTILLVPGMILLIENILNNDSVWKIFKKSLPYKHWEIDRITGKLNKVSVKSLLFWKNKVNPILTTALNEIREHSLKKDRFFIDELIKKTNKISESTCIPFNPKKSLKISVSCFNKNLIYLLRLKEKNII